MLIRKSVLALVASLSLLAPFRSTQAASLVDFALDAAGAALYSPPCVSGGSGTASDPVVLCSAQDFNTLIPAGLIIDAKHYKLGQNIDFAGTGPNYLVGTNVPVYGIALQNGAVFDGAGRTISNVVLRNGLTSSVLGFFRSSTNRSIIKNLNLDNVSTIAYNTYVLKTGALVGVLIDSEVINCHVTKGAVTNYGAVGGLVGIADHSPSGLGGNMRSLIRGSSYSGTVTSIGTAYTWTIPRESVTSFAGGIVGWATVPTVFEHNFADADVTTAGNAGGLLGAFYSFWSNDPVGTGFLNPRIVNSFATGTLASSSGNLQFVRPLSGSMDFTYRFTTVNSENITSITNLDQSQANNAAFLQKIENAFYRRAASNDLVLNSTVHIILGILPHTANDLGAAWAYWFRYQLNLDRGDSDRVPYIYDNCALKANTSQLDSDGDNFGNACDADYDNDTFVSGADFGSFLFGFGSSCGQANYNEELDADGDCAVTVTDFGSFLSQFNGLVGPSGLAVL